MGARALLVSITAIAAIACSAAPSTSSPTPTQAIAATGTPATPSVAPTATAAAVATTPAATASVAATATATAAAVITDPSKLVSADEAAALLGKVIAKSGPGAVDLWIGPLNGYSFAGANGSPYFAVGIAPAAGGGGADLCKPNPQCPSYDQVRAGQPKTGSVADLPGIGDKAFAATQGAGVALVGAVKGATAVYLYALGSSYLNALEVLLATVVTRI